MADINAVQSNIIERKEKDNLTQFMPRVMEEVIQIEKSLIV